MSDILPIFLFVVLVILNFAVYSHGLNDSRNQIDRWLEVEAKEIIICERRWSRIGPFWSIQVPKCSFFFYVNFRDTKGEIKHAYICAAKKWFGLGEQFFRVEWDDGKGGYILG